MRIYCIALAALMLTSCQKAFDIRIENRGSGPVVAFSDDWHSSIQPGESSTGPFPSKQNGGQLVITADHRRLCYDLSFDIDRHGTRKLLDRHILVSVLDR